MLKLLNKKHLISYSSLKYFSTNNAKFKEHNCKLLVIGGGSGGCSVSAKFAKDLQSGEIIIVEPSNVHYYQPMFTLIGGGIKKLEDSSRNMKDVLPKKATWIQESAVEFNPKKNQVTISNGDTIKYDFMLVAAGLQLHYEAIPGLIEGLEIPNSGVCSNYSPKYVNKTYEALQNIKSGNAVFTFPNTPIKCAGAPQKIAYIAEDYLRKVGKRDNVNVIYNTSLGVIFGVKKYADALWKVCKKRNINVNLRTNLIEVQPHKNVAVFENLDKPDEKMMIEYSMLHVTPPMSAPDVLKKCTDLTNEAGYVDVEKHTLQHVRFPNVFAIGDCSSCPNSKTAAAVAAQCSIVYNNMKAVMAGHNLSKKYDGYSSCPLVTGAGKCILAEFDYDLNPLETFPISQDKELWLMYMMKKDIMPPLYWHFMMKGYWNGPSIVRKLLHLGFTK